MGIHLTDTFGADPPYNVTDGNITITAVDTDANGLLTAGDAISNTGIAPGTVCTLDLAPWKGVFTHYEFTA